MIVFLRRQWRTHNSTCQKSQEKPQLDVLTAMEKPQLDVSTSIGYGEPTTQRVNVYRLRWRLCCEVASQLVEHLCPARSPEPTRLRTKLKMMTHQSMNGELTSEGVRQKRHARLPSQPLAHSADLLTRESHGEPHELLVARGEGE